MNLDDKNGYVVALKMGRAARSRRNYLARAGNRLPASIKITDKTLWINLHHFPAQIGRSPVAITILRLTAQFQMVHSIGLKNQYGEGR